MPDLDTKTPKKTNDKVFDIAKPGKTAADSTARPIIVTNRPVMKDPMVAPAPQSAEVEHEFAMETPVAAKVALKPLTAAEKAEDPAEDNAEDIVPIIALSPAGATNTSAVPHKTADAATQVESQAEAEKPVPDEPTGAAPALKEVAQSKETTADTEDDELTTRRSKRAADAEATALEAAVRQQEEIDNLVASKEYFLPIDSVERRRSRLATIFGLLLIIILGLALLDALLDAGMLKINGLQPVTHFFSSWRSI